MLNGLFEDFELSTELVNISSETENGTISQRVTHWLNLSDRHIYIGRGSIWGNPFNHKKENITREESIAQYKKYLMGSSLQSFLFLLKGKRLGCWCSPLVCHGNVLLDLISQL